MVSCSERLLENPTQHSEDEILNRIAVDLMVNRKNTTPTTATHLQFRLLLIQRQASQIEQEIFFYSRIEPLPLPGKKWS